MIRKVDNRFCFPQWIAGVAVTLLLVHMGLQAGWTSPTLARLTAPDSPLPLQPEQASWVASLVNFSRFFGGVLGAVATHYLGSKRAILLTSFPVALGWLLVGLATSPEWLYAARLFSGLGLGMGFLTFPLYIGEVSMPEIRGALVSLAILGAPFGQFVASVCGSYLPVAATGFGYFGLAVLLSLIFLWLPESPHHYVRVGEREAAERSIQWYRAGRGVDAELEAVENFVSSDGEQSFAEKLAEFRTRPVRRAALHVLGQFSFQQIGGLNVVMFFMEEILVRARFTLIQPSLVVIYVNLGTIFASGLAIFLIDRCGRRFLLLLSSVGTTLGLLGLMAHFALMDRGYDAGELQWLPVGSVFLFMIAYFLGLMPVPNAMLSEMFSASVKCIAACIAILTGAVMSFLSAKTYQPLVDAMGEFYVFLIYAVGAAVVIPYTLFLMPETKGKSLQRIQDELMAK